MAECLLSSKEYNTVTMKCEFVKTALIKPLPAQTQTKLSRRWSHIEQRLFSWHFARRRIPLLLHSLFQTRDKICFHFNVIIIRVD